MTVYVDSAGIRARVGSINGVWYHLTADTQKELHEFALSIGLKRSWFQSDNRPGVLTFPGGWHYDVTRSKRVAAVAAGAVECDREQFFAVIKRPGREGRERFDA